jgi:hypothetical protein
MPITKSTMPIAASTTSTEDRITVWEAKEGISKYMDFYNQERPHQSLDYRTPSEVYLGRDNKTKEASWYLTQAKILS